MSSHLLLLLLFSCFGSSRQVRLVDMIRQNLSETSLAPLWRHHKLRSEEVQLSLATELRNAVLGISAQIWWRFELVFDAWPYRLLLLCDPDVPASEKRARARELKDAKECCLDLPCTRQIKKKHPEPDSL